MGKVQRWQGYGLAVVSSLGFSSLGIFARFGYMAGVDTVTMLVWRFSLSALFLALVWLVRKYPWPHWRDVLHLGFMGGILYAIMSMAFFLANKYAPVGIASVILYVYPALVTIELAILGEKITRNRVVSLLVTGLGVVIMVGVGAVSLSPRINVGMGFAFLAAILYSLYITMGSRVLKRVSAVPATVLVLASGSLTTFVVGIFTHTLQILPMTSMPTILGMSLFATVIGVGGFLIAVAIIGAGQSAIVSTVEPVGAIVLGGILFGQSFGAWQFGGIAMVLVGAFMLEIGSATRMIKRWKRVVKLPVAGQRVSTPSVFIDEATPVITEDIGS